MFNQVYIKCITNVLRGFKDFGGSRGAQNAQAAVVVVVVGITVCKDLCVFGVF